MTQKVSFQLVDIVVNRTTNASTRSRSYVVRDLAASLKLRRVGTGVELALSGTLDPTSDLTGGRVVPL
jgi:hypothetical protein